MDDLNSPPTLSNSGLIDAETFDFNLSVSPESQKSGNTTQEDDVFVEKLGGNDKEEAADDDDEDDDDEVYLGPVSFKEKCIATRVELVEKKEQNPLEKLLTAEQYVELFKEANSIALQLGEGQENKEKSVKPCKISPPALAGGDQELKLSVDLDIAVSNDPEREHKHDGGDAKLEPGGLSVIERYKRLTKKTVRSPRRDTYLVDKNQTKRRITPAVKASSEGPTRKSKLRGGIAMQKRKSDIPNPLERAKPSQLTGPSGASLPVPRTRRSSSSGSQDGNRDVLNTSSSSNSSISSVSSLPCSKQLNSSQMPRLSKLRPPKGKQDGVVNKRGSLVMQHQPAKDNQSADVQQRKIPASKPSLLKPSGLTGRSSGLARPKPASASQKIVSPLKKRKSQPLKATLTMEKVLKPTEATGQSENCKRSSLRRPSTPCTPRGQEKPLLPCTPRGQEKPLLPRKRILSSASSSATTAVSSCSDLDSSIPSVGTPARSRRRSCLPTPKKETPTSVKRRAVFTTPNKDQGETRERLSSLRSHSSTKLDGSPPAKKAAILRAVQSNISDLNSPSLNASTPDLKPMKLTQMRVKEEPSTSPAIGTLINFNELPTKSVPNPFLKDLFKTEEVKENLIEF
ncbi:uncharacterized protein [Apostichopus japonicus]|uniref:uncharacterized protein isoform X2 n=1 Tax=Stichopus japonicus TaxID=307972 RepID=UPI003AB5A8E4